MTRKPNTQNRAPLICLSGQPALELRLAASSRGGNEWAWAMNATPTTAAVWDERMCEVAGDAAQNSRAVEGIGNLVARRTVLCAVLAVLRAAAGTSPYIGCGGVLVILFLNIRNAMATALVAVVVGAIRGAG